MKHGICHVVKFATKNRRTAVVATGILVSFRKLLILVLLVCWIGRITPDRTILAVNLETMLPWPMNTVITCTTRVGALRL